MLKKILIVILSFCLAFSSPVWAANKAYNTAYKAWKYAKQHGYTSKDIFVYVDFSLPSTQKRFFIYKGNTLLYSTYATHGVGSGKGIHTVKFSNVSGSRATSLGVQVTKEYHVGKHGLNLRMKGLEKWNSNVYPRYIEIHGATYIGNGKVGTSWGCYAVPKAEINKVLTIVGTGTILVSYANDANWLNNSRFLNG